MRKKFLSICFLLIFITSLSIALMFNKMMKKHYIDMAFSTGLSQAKLINVFLNENKNQNISLYRIAQFFGNKCEYRITFITPEGKPIADSKDNSVIFTTYNNINKNQLLKLKSPFYRIVESPNNSHKILEIFTSKTTVQGKDIILVLSKELTFWETFQKKLIAIISISIFVSGIISIILSIIFINRATRPITLLTQAVRDMGKGKFDTNITIKSDDEIQELADNFNFMCNKINTLLKTIESRAKNLQIFLDNLQTSVFVIDVKGKILLINKSAINEFNLLNSHSNIFEYPELDFLALEIKNAIANNKTLNYKATNKEETYKIKLNYIHENNKQVIITAQNITKIENAEKLRKEFVANASHELKTPITIISGFVETIKLGYAESPEQLEHFFNIIEEEIIRLTSLTNSLLKLSHLENSTKEIKNSYPLNLKETFEDIVILFKNIANKKNINIVTNIQNVDVKVPTSKEWLRTVVGNLIDNAIKYSNCDSTITIDVTTSPKKLIFSVKDQGIGIKEEDIKNIFRRFYRADKSRNRKIEGTGLGLSIVKNMILKVNGKIKVNSEINKGTTFIVTIPFSE